MNNKHFIEKYGPWAIITGASSGLGAELARQLSCIGLNLVLVARREDRLKRLAQTLEKENGIQTRILAIDLTMADAYLAILDQTKDLDTGLLINNAGYSNTGELLESTPENVMLMYRLNCEFPLLLAMEYGKRMVQKGRGGIIFVASSVAYLSVPYWTHYSATKSYILRIGEGLYYELKNRGVDVLTLCPGGMKTEFQSVAGIRDIGAMDVKPVAIRAIKSLGKRPSIVPGWYNRVAYQMLPKLLPTKVCLALFGILMKKLAFTK